MIALTRRFRFSASHRLHSHAFNAEENAAIYGKCNHPFGHGHDYVVEVTVAGEVDGRTGQLVPVPVLDDLVERQVLRLFASRNINVEVPQFERMVPTTENIAGVIAAILLDAWEEWMGNRVSLRRIGIRETGRNSFEILIGRSSSPMTEEVLVHAKKQYC